MLTLDLKLFGEKAGWSRLPPDIARREFHLTASSSQFPGALLPAISPNGEVFWYTAAASHAQWRELQPLLLAYAGPTVTTFNGQAALPDPNVPAEEVFRAAGIETIAILKPSREALGFASQALHRLCRALDMRPISAPYVPETTGNILSQLEMSLAAGDRAEADRILEQLREEFRLDTLNLHFLEVRVLSWFGEWTQLVKADWFAELCVARKPAVVASAMLEALWHAYLESHAANAEQFAAQYRSSVQLYARPLLAQAAPRASDIIERLRVLEAPVPVTPDSPAERAQELLDQAAEAPSNERLASASAAIDALPLASREKLIGSAAAQQALAETGSIEGPFPRDCLSWLAALADPSFDGAVASAREGMTVWPIDQISGVERARPIAEKLLQVGLTAGLAKDRLMESLPSLVLWVKRDADYPRPSLGEIYEALLQLLAIIERRNSSTREAAADLLDAILRVGTTQTTYRQLLADIGGLLDEGAGQSTVYWLIDVADVLLQHPAPDANARAEVLSRILSSMHPLLARLTGGQRAAYERIAAGAGWPVLPPPVNSGEGGLAAEFGGKTIAIYTLTESAGQQAQAALRALLPGAHVECSHDHVASPRLTRLARDADIFVVAAASAKHAATDCVSRHRGTKPLLYAAGRGFSSIVRAVEEYLQARLEAHAA